MNGLELLMRLNPLLLALSLPVLLAACGEPADTRPGQPVTQRRLAFTKILKPFEAMGVRLRKDQYDAQVFVDLAKSLDAAKDAPWQFFGPETNYPPTHATAKVWSEPERYAAAREKFLVATAGMQIAAASRDEAKVRQAYEAVHESCRGCHKVFKD
jgi:cytochrome c556